MDYNDIYSNMFGYIVCFESNNLKNAKRMLGNWGKTCAERADFNNKNLIKTLLARLTFNGNN